MTKFFERKRIKLRNEIRYTKIMDSDFSRGIENKIQSFTNNHVNAVVINFVDMIAHSRSDNAILKEIAPGWTPAEVQELTEPRLIIAEDLKEMELL